MDFALVTTNLLLARALQRTTRWQHNIAIATAIVVLLWLYGSWRITTIEMAGQDAHNHSIAMVQTNFDSDISKNAALQQLTQMTLALLDNQSPQLLIWPELPAPPRPRGDLRFKQSVEAIYAGGDNITLLTPVSGAVPERHPQTGRNYQRNSLALFNNAKLWDRHHKTRLLPFVEYLPFEQQLPQLRSLFPKTAHYLPGKPGNTVTSPDGLNLVPLICYESSSAALTRKAVANGGQLLVNIVNDIWTLNEQNALKHLRLASLRSVETRRPMVRVTNQGSSAYIAPTGNIADNTRLSDKSFATQVVAVPQVSHRSVYVQYGDWFVWVLWGMIGVFALIWPVIVRQHYTKTDTVILSK